MLAIVLIVGGLGGAAFHPPAAVLVHQHSGAHRGLAMSFHITSGTLGQAMAPLPLRRSCSTSDFVRHRSSWCRRSSCWAVSCCDACRRSNGCRNRRAAADFAALRPYARPLSLLYLIVVLRTLTAISFSTFVPVMLTRRGMTIAQAGTAVSIYLFAVGLGGFFGGPTADRFGARRVIILSLVCAVPFLAVAPLLSGWSSSRRLRSADSCCSPRCP